MMRLRSILMKFDEKLGSEELLDITFDELSDYEKDTMKFGEDSHIIRFEKENEPTFVISEDTLGYFPNNEMTKKESEEKMEWFKEKLEKKIGRKLDVLEKEKIYSKKIDFDVFSVFKEDFLESLKKLETNDLELQIPSIPLSLVKDNEIEEKIEFSYDSPEAFRNNKVTVVGNKEKLNKIEGCLKWKTSD